MNRAAALRIGTLGSALARAQTSAVVRAIAAKTGGEPDVVTVGGDGSEPSALRDALLAGQCDVVVHRLDDLPTEPHPGLVIGAIPKRADARDSVCASNALTLDTLPAGARVGTDSPRRAAQLRSRRPDVEAVDTRGDVGSRIGLVASGELDAVVLAVADLSRLGRLDVVSEYLDLAAWPTDAGQGAVAIEVRKGEEQTVFALNHTTSRLLVEMERQTRSLLAARCSAVLGVRALVEDGMLFLDARVYSADGARYLTSSHALYLADSANPAGELAERVSTELFELGAATL